MALIQAEAYVYVLADDEFVFSEGMIKQSLTAIQHSRVSSREPCDGEDAEEENG